jgi:hypothetical protein
MDKEKEGLLTSAQEAIASAAKINVDAAIEAVSSAATNLVDALTGKPRKNMTSLECPLMGWTGRVPARRLRAQSNPRSTRHGPQSQRQHCDCDWYRYR